MFIGHFAVGFASKRAAPRASLGVLMAAPLFLDLLWPIFLIAGVESVRIDPGNTAFTPLDLHDYPWSHSLVTSLAWSAVFAAAFWAATRYGRGSFVLAVGVFSHWVLDFVTHRPDMPLYPGGRGLGLGLWNSVSGTVVTESVMFAAGLWLYAAGTRARDGVGRYGFWALVAVLLLSYYSSLFSPPPPQRALAIGGIVFGWLFVLWAGWADGHRDATLSGGALSG